MVSSCSVGLVLLLASRLISSPMAFNPPRSTANLENKIRQRDLEMSEELPAPQRRTEVTVFATAQPEVVDHTQPPAPPTPKKDSVFATILELQKTNDNVFVLEVICIEGFDATAQPFTDPLKMRMRVRCQAISATRHFWVVVENMKITAVKNMIQFLRKGEKVLVFQGGFERLSPRFETWLVFKVTQTTAIPVSVAAPKGFDWKYYPEPGYNLIQAVIVDHRAEETQAHQTIFTVQLCDKKVCTLFYNINVKQPLSVNGKSFLWSIREWKGQNVTLIGMEVPAQQSSGFPPALKTRVGKAAVMLSPDALLLLDIPKATPMVPDAAVPTESPFGLLESQ